MGAREYARGRRVVARLPHGGDLLEEIATVADEHGMRGGRAARHRRAQGRPPRLLRPGAHSTASSPWTRRSSCWRLLGNVSRKDGATFVHAHATLAGHDGACVGGHVAPGCVIFACELLLQELVGEPLEREFDEVTGLALWRGL